MKTFLVLALFALAAWTFGPQLFAGEIVINGLKTPEPPTLPVARSCEPVAPAVYGPDGESPIFLEPKSRSEAPKRQENPKTARNVAPPSTPGCWGPVCYRAPTIRY